MDPAAAGHLPGPERRQHRVLAIAVALGVLVVLHPTAAWSGQAFYAIVGLAVLFGVLLHHPDRRRGHAPVISILNSYAGSSARRDWLRAHNKLLVTPARSTGSSGLILSNSLMAGR